MGNFFLCVLVNLLATGLGLSCIQCTNATIPACRGTIKNCPENKQCISTLIQTTTTSGQKTLTFERGCGKVDLCNISGSMSGLIATEIISACCNVDSCTPSLPNLMSGKKLLNDVRCPVCLAHNEDDCYASEMRSCSGAERYCALYKVKRDSETTIIGGCATASFCHTAQGQKFENGHMISVSAKCVRSGSCSVIHESLALLLVVVLGKAVG